MKIRLSLLILVLLVSGIGFAQNADNVIKLSSQILNKERELIIHLPHNYEQSEKKYPVLYLLDGRTHIEHASSAVSYLSRFGIIPEMIVDAVINVDRTRDFSPTHVDERPTTAGA